MIGKHKKIIFFSSIGWAFFMTIISLNLMNRVIALELNQSFNDGDIRSSIQRLSEDVYQLKSSENQYSGTFE